jgi:hypothetical protein
MDNLYNIFLLCDLKITYSLLFKNIIINDQISSNKRSKTYKMQMVLYNWISMGIDLEIMILGGKRK